MATEEKKYSADNPGELIDALFEGKISEAEYRKILFPIKDEVGDSNAKAKAKAEKGKVEEEKEEKKSEEKSKDKEAA